jgi:hypothetical protein
MKRVMQNPQIERQLKDEGPGHLLRHHPDTVAAKYLEVIAEALVSR